MGDRRLRRLRQQDRHAVAAREPVAGQRVGEAVGEALQIVEAEMPLGAVLVEMDEGETVASVGVAVADVDADVVAVGHRPAEGADERLVVGRLRQHGRGPLRRAGIAGSSFRISIDSSRREGCGQPAAGSTSACAGPARHALFSAQRCPVPIVIASRHPGR
jgi:hypothetical protein